MDIKRTIDELEPYKNAKGAIFKDLGDEQASDLLYRAFEGNAQQAAAFLGYNASGGGKVVVRKWKACGLKPNGIPQQQTPFKQYYYPNPPEAVDGLHEAYLNMTRREERALYAVLPVKTRARIIFLGDVHLGSPHCDFARYTELLQWARRAQDTWLIGMGDILNVATKDSAGGTRDRAITLKESMHLAKTTLEPVKHKFLCLLSGNHEYRIQRATDEYWDPMEAIAEELHIPYGMDSSFIVTDIISDKGNKQRYTIFAHHGFGGGRTQGYIWNKREALAGAFEADIIAAGHDHARGTQFTTRQHVVEVDGDFRVRRKDIAIVASGSFLLSDKGSYTRAHGLRPAVLGAATILLHADIRKIEERT